MSLSNRLARLEALITAKAQAKQRQIQTERTKALQARFAAMDQGELLREYEALRDTPVAHNPVLDGKSADELIQIYFQLARG